MINKIKEYINKIVSSLTYVLILLSLISSFYIFIYSMNVYVKILSTFLFVLIFIVGYINRYKIISFINITTRLIKQKWGGHTILILLLLCVLLRVLYINVFMYDYKVLNNDFLIYTNIADEIVEKGFVTISNVQHWIGLGSILSVFRKIGVSYLDGCFLIFILTIIIYYFSFNRIIGKEKTFICLVLYILMPSTNLWILTPTHELFVFFAFSIILACFTKIVYGTKLINLIISCVLIVFANTVLKIVSPLFYISMIINIILIFYCMNRKSLLLICLFIITIGFSKIVDVQINSIYRGSKKIDNVIYHQLMIGSDIKTGGRLLFSDQNERKYADYLNSNNIKITEENIKDVSKVVLLNQYKYLITHPIDLIKLLSYKYFISWSGDYYFIEVSQSAKKLDTNLTISNIGYILQLALSVFNYFIILFISFISGRRINNNSQSFVYKLYYCGIVCFLLIVELQNRYSCHTTLLVMLLALSYIKNDKIKI